MCGSWSLSGMVKGSMGRVIGLSVQACEAKFGDQR